MVDQGGERPGSLRVESGAVGTDLPRLGRATVNGEVRWFSHSCEGTQHAFSPLCFHWPHWPFHCNPVKNQTNIPGLHSSPLSYPSQPDPLTSKSVVTSTSPHPAESSVPCSPASASTSPPRFSCPGLQRFYQIRRKPFGS